MAYLNFILFITVFLYNFMICEKHQAKTTHIHAYVILKITGMLQKIHFLFLLNKVLKYSASLPVL